MLMPASCTFRDLHVAIQDVMGWTDSEEGDLLKWRSRKGCAYRVLSSPMRISHLIKGARPVTAELALLFGRAFSQTPQYWLNLQASYDLKMARASIGKRLAGIRTLAHV